MKKEKQSLSWSCSLTPFLREDGARESKLRTSKTKAHVICCLTSMSLDIMEIIPITHKVEYLLMTEIILHLTKVCECLLGARHWAECWKCSGEQD